MLKNLSYMILLVFIWSCGKESTTVLCDAKPKADCVCTLEYNPVCGCDGKVYGNACSAGCNGVAVLYKGACGSERILGSWDFMGYVQKDKVDLAKVTKKIPFDNVSITFDNNDLTDQLPNFSGRSSVNFISGNYSVTSSKLEIKNTIMTKIAGTLEALKFEDEYVENLNNAASYTIKDNVLIIKIVKEGQALDEMVFLKK